MIPRYHFRIDVLSPLAIGTGEPTLLADDSLPRRRDGRPYIPATTLKGRVRDLTRVAEVDPDRWRTAFGVSDTAPAAALLTDAVAPREAPAEVEHLTTVALDERRVARTGALTTMEVIAPSPDVAHPCALFGAVLPSPTAASDDARASAGLLLAGLAAVTDLGARTRRGWGQVRIALAPESAELAASTMEGLHA